MPNSKVVHLFFQKRPGLSRESTLLKKEEEEKKGFDSLFVTHIDKLKNNQAIYKDKF